MDWNLYRCGRAGHVTYAPDEPPIAAHVRATTASAELWRCLRCGTFVPAQQHGSGPVTQAPLIRRGAEIRSEIILRIFAIERIIRFVLFGALAFGVWRFGHSQRSLQEAFEHEYPILRNLFHQLGFNISHSSLVGLYQRALHLSPHTLGLVAAGLAVFAVVELIEGVGLWLAKRWGEYFAAVVTSLGLPYEIYDLSNKVTWFRIVLFLLNLALVVYLIVTKRLFGVRGGKKAYEARLRTESVFDEAQRFAADTEHAGFGRRGLIADPASSVPSAQADAAGGDGRPSPPPPSATMTTAVARDAATVPVSATGKDATTSDDLGEPGPSATS